MEEIKKQPLEREETKEPPFKTANGFWTKLKKLVLYLLALCLALVLVEIIISSIMSLMMGMQWAEKFCISCSTIADAVNSAISTLFLPGASAITIFIFRDDLKSFLKNSGDENKAGRDKNIEFGDENVRLHNQMELMEKRIATLEETANEIARALKRLNR